MIVNRRGPMWLFNSLISNKSSIYGVIIEGNVDCFLPGLFFYRKWSYSLSCIISGAFQTKNDLSVLYTIFKFYLMPMSMHI